MGTTLLLADDSITIQKVVGIIFANEDYELVVVDNGIAALEKAKESRPDVMLVDALMPGKNGYEVCEEVRRDPLLRDVPLLLLVGAFEPFDEDRARNSGADDHITKPFESQSLIDKVRELAELGRSRQAAVPPPAPEPVMPAFAPVPEPETAPFSDSSANLIDSFKGYVHLGGNPTPPETPEPSAEAEHPVEMEPPVAAEPPVPTAGFEPAADAETETGRVILLSTVDIVEASPEDDPWGTFAEEVTEGEPIQFGEVLDGEGPAELPEAVEEIEPFTLLDDETSPVSFETLPSPASFGEEETADPAVAEEFSFSEPLSEPSLHDGFAAVEAAAEPERSESISLGVEPEDAGTPPAWEPATDSALAAEPFTLGLDGEESDLPFAPEEDYIPAAGFSDAPVTTSEPVEVRIDEPATPAAGSGLVTLTEEQLAAAISKVSLEVIERIAWEVVPDLAETIILEEIRKLKEGLSR